MNIDDTVRLCKLVKALAPAQKIDDETPAIWQGVMANIELADAMEAVKHIAQTQAFVAPCDIIQRVKAARAARVDGVDTDLPAVDPDNVPEYLAAIREMRARRAGKPGREERPVRREVGHFERHAIEAGEVRVPRVPAPGAEGRRGPGRPGAPESAGVRDTGHHRRGGQAYRRRPGPAGRRARRHHGTG